MQASPFGVSVNGSNQLHWTLTWNTGAQYDYTNMSGTNWLSSATSVATVQTGLVHGVSPGSVGMTAYYGGFVPGYASQICVYGTSPCPVGGSSSGGSSGTVTPTISQNATLWYFNGNPTPSGFTLGSTTATLTAIGGGSGTYTWSITAGSSKAALQGTTSGSNLTSVTIASSSYSTSVNDVTVQLQLNGTQTSFKLSVDSPYKLVSNGTTTTRGITGSCSVIPGASGTSGFQTLVPYAIISFLGTQITNIQTAETLNNQQVFYSGETWPFQAGTFTTSTGTFVDNICASGALHPQPLPPQSPLSSIAIDTLSQTWTVGGGSTAPGLSVQTDTLRRFIDHGNHASIVSPTR